jgi:hypothetical protein
MTIWRMRFACWIPKATNTLRLPNTHCSSTATMVARTPLNVTLHVHCLSCYLFNLWLAREPLTVAAGVRRKTCPEGSCSLA